MRAKARSTALPAYIRRPAADYVAVAQYGLGAYERFLAEDRETWLEAALAVGRFLVDTQEPDGSWLNQQSFLHTLPMRAPWRCAMAQGQGASLLVRLYAETGEEQFATRARAALEPLSRSSDAGGVAATLDGESWPEEYPTAPPSYVLNGAIFAWWGVRDVAVGLGEVAAAEAFEAAVETLAGNLERFDTGWWSLYCLRRFPVAPVASSFYQALHVSQLEAMNLLAPRPQFEAMRARWAAFLESPRLRRRAFATKVAFRLVVPRNRILGPHLPWSHL
jgi:hypothetical protein